MTVKKVDESLAKAAALREQALKAPLTEKTQRDQAALLWREAAVTTDAAKDALCALRDRSISGRVVLLPVEASAMAKSS